MGNDDDMQGSIFINMYCIFIYIYKSQKGIQYLISYHKLHAYIFSPSLIYDLTSPQKKIHKRGRSTCRRTPRFVAVCIVHSVHVGCWGKALHRWSWIEPRGCDPNATLSGVTIPDLRNFRWAGGPSPKKTRSRFEMLGIYIVLRELTMLTIVRNVLFLIKDFKQVTSEKMGRQL